MKKKHAKTRPEKDSVYFLKLVLYIVIGSQWLYISNVEHNQQIPIPIGLFLGLFFVSKEHFQIDKKIEYALLLGAMFVGFWLPMGITIVR